MVITMEIKYVVKRGKQYYFRMLVPKDCVKTIGKREIVIALKTSDPLVAKTSAAKLGAFWAEQFKKAREASSPVPAKNSTTPPEEDGEAFRQKLLELREKNMPRLLKAESDKELRDRLCILRRCLAMATECPMGGNSSTGLTPCFMQMAGSIWMETG